MTTMSATDAATATPPTEPPPEPDVDIFAAAHPRLGLIVGLNAAAGFLTVVPFIAIVALSDTLLPAARGEAIDVTRTWGIVVAAGVALVARFGLLWSAGLVSHLVDNDMQDDIRRRLIDRIRRVPLGWFDSAASGGVKKAVENDVNALHQLIAHAIQDFTLAVTVPVVSIIYLFAIDWRMAVAALVPLAAVLALFPWMMRGYEDRYREYDASLVRLTNATVEFVHGIAVVKSFGQIGRSHQRYRDETHAFARFYDDWMRATKTPQTLIDVLTAPIVVLVYLVGVAAWLVTAAGMDPIHILPALLLGLGLTAPYLTIGFTAQFLRDAVKAKASIEALLRTPVVAYPSIPATPHGNRIVAEEVTFSYDGEHEVLREVIARCEPGTVTALVGPSGSGKSTLARLVPRFYDVTGGRMLVAGADVRDLSQGTLYDRVGFVFQDPYLLRTSIRDNIRLARPEADDAQVERVARAAQIHDRILGLPRGYDSVVGQDANLSGGEQQRVAIARGLLTDAPILVLDEATAFADPDSEAAIQRALSELAQGRTVLVIAHRLHTVTGVDQILVLDGGRVVEQGTHAELVGAGGLYTALWTSYERARKATRR